MPKGLVLSLVVVCTLLFTGWKGWEMVYRHRVGVADTIERRETSTTAPRRAASSSVDQSRYYHRVMLVITVPGVLFLVCPFSTHSAREALAVRLGLLPFSASAQCPLSALADPLVPRYSLLNLAVAFECDPF